MCHTLGRHLDLETGRAYQDFVTGRQQRIGVVVNGKKRRTEARSFHFSSAAGSPASARFVWEGRNGPDALGKSHGSAIRRNPEI